MISNIVKLVTLFLLFLTSLDATKEQKKRSRFFKPKKYEPTAPKPPPPKLNTDNLPPIEEILEGLGLIHRLPMFIKQGITETRFLLRMKPMDFNMMVPHLLFHSQNFLKLY